MGIVVIDYVSPDLNLPWYEYHWQIHGSLHRWCQGEIPRLRWSLKRPKKNLFKEKTSNQMNSLRCTFGNKDVNFVGFVVPNPFSSMGFTMTLLSVNSIMVG